MAAAFDKIQQTNGQIRYRKDKQYFKEAEVPEVVKEALTFQNIVDENGLVIVEDKGNFGESEKSESTTNTAQEDQSNATNDSGSGDDSSDEDQNAAEKPATVPVTTAPEAPVATVDTVEAPVVTPSVPEQHAQDMANTPTRAFKSKTPQSKPGFGWPRKNGKTVDIFDEVTPHTHIRSVGGFIVPLSAESYRTKTDAQIEDRLRELGYELIDINDYANQAAENTNDTRDEFGDEDGTISDDI